MNEHEDGLALFLEKRRRNRFRDALVDPARRQRLREHDLDHITHFDRRYAHELPVTADVLAELRARGAPETCRVVSSDIELDERTMSLEEALGRVVDGDFGTFVSCLPGRLAFYQGAPGPRLLLERPG